ncbi:OmpA family protein [Pelotalea chapellei]|uniref:OmpA family protein n=1 Tax=Pelotalea chapellei TaxID=44671 RepID=A0ABS5U793_9BACT|nr:OmpA family protein [Pelotalea chapellei]MBT1071535.1 OmpA family protein [Pelotalea chapellei]
MKNFFAILIAIFISTATSAFANPGQNGSTGLISVPSADTLDAGNVCIGVWTDLSENSNQAKKSALIAPVSITLGIGSFWEIYGAYPNILFNDNEDASGKGTLDLGTKLRFLGSRDSFFKVAADFLAQRHISENLSVDGTTDLSAKVIASYSKNQLGIHMYAGYLFPGSLPGLSRDNGFLFGAGIEYLLFSRTKLLGEIVGSTSSYPSSELSAEASLGLQYFLSPHFTFNVSAGTGLGKNDPDFRLIAGLSSCQGVGSYVQPIPSVGRKFVQKGPAKDLVKPLKIIPISTLLLKASAPLASPANRLEVEMDGDGEEVYVKPYGQVTIAPQQASSNLTSPVIPVEVPGKTREEEITLLPSRSTKDLEASAVEYTLNRIRGITPLYGVDVKGTEVMVPDEVVLPGKMAVYRKFRFPDVTFDFDQWTLSAEGKKMLSEVADQIRKDKKWHYLKIDGHTDGIGSVSYNMDLSLKRSIAVATYLISHEGLDPLRVFIKGFGKSAALADNNSAEGRKKNRRTEVMLLVNKDGQ